VALIDAARERFGFIDLFFANAGVAVGTDLASTDEATWETAMNVNLHAHRWAAAHLLPEWLAAGRGHFCSTASAAGLLAQIGSATYSVSKHAAVAFAEWVAVTYGPKGVRVSCLCPMGVKTRMTMGDDFEGRDDTMIRQVRAAGEMLDPANVADHVARAVAEERFLVLPHPEVATYVERKATDRDRWLAGMRRFQSALHPDGDLPGNAIAPKV